VGNDVRTEVVRGGTLRSRKGMHLPRAEAHVEPFTDRDALALEMAIAAKVDFLGLSFVRRAEDVERVRAMLPSAACDRRWCPRSRPPQRSTTSPASSSAADAVMVARGDLGIQMPARRVPLLQKEIIRFCNQAGKPVITATQMLESMTRSPLPTRAEVNDVANAVLDGTDALMLSEETAVGLFPNETVRMMSEVAESAEGWPRERVVPEASRRRRRPRRLGGRARRGAGGRGPRRGRDPVPDAQRSNGASRRRLPTAVPIAGISANPAGARRALAGLGRAAARTVPENLDPSEQLRLAIAAARAAGIVREGDLVAFVFGSAGPRAGSTDSVRIVRA
jgi:pyruvate kinase